jgi:hypothetical protein
MTTEQSKVTLGETLREKQRTNVSRSAAELFMNQKTNPS